MLRAMYESMLLHVGAAWKSEPPTVGFAADANSSVVLRRSLSKWGRLWRSKFDDLSTDMATRFASKAFKTTDNALMASLKAAGFTVKFSATPDVTQAYKAVVAENVSLIRSIPEQFLKNVETSVWDSVMRGADLATLSQSLQKNYGVSYRRAAFISLDQNNKAKAIIENVRRDKLGIARGRWLHSGAGKEPRPEHVAFSQGRLGGPYYDLKKGAYLEGKWVWPGSEPGCRCASSAVIEGLNDS
jgi:hypothetical protein